MAINPANNLTTATGSAAEVLLTPKNARLISIFSPGTNTGVLQLREAGAVGSGASARVAIGATQTFYFGSQGVAFAGGLSYQATVAGDTWYITWGSLL
jgi:hypothetical protein